jgi:threonine synthase
MPSAPLYDSTRGHGPVGLVEALVQGLAPDGGLYLPVRIPRVDCPQRGTLADVAVPILAPFLPDGSEGWVRAALSFDTPLQSLSPSTALLDLTRGPTAAFKDVGARFLARALATLAPVERGRTRTVLVATSGDTGGAVAAAFHGLPGMRVVVLFPAGAVSPRQRLQFTTLGDDVVALGVSGPFDACQRLVKDALGDPGLVDRHLLTSANSINIGRLLPQMSWYIKAMVERGGAGRPPVTFVVPSGNLGNLTAGVLAAHMVDRETRFVAAVNDNAAFVDWLDGTSTPDRATVHTPSTAMDVGRPSNLERIEALVARIPGLRARLQAISIGAPATLDAMRRHHRDTGRFVDPHTAVGLAALAHIDAPGEVVVLATADAGKFPDTVAAATGVGPPVPPALVGLDERRERWSRLEPDLDALRQVLDAPDGNAS